MWPLVKPGGIVAFDDWRHPRFKTFPRLVAALLREVPHEVVVENEQLWVRKIDWQTSAVPSFHDRGDAQFVWLECRSQTQSSLARLTRRSLNPRDCRGAGDPSFGANSAAALKGANSIPSPSANLASVRGFQSMPRTHSAVHPFWAVRSRSADLPRRARKCCVCESVPSHARTRETTSAAALVSRRADAVR